MTDFVRPDNSLVIVRALHVSPSVRDAKTPMPAADCPDDVVDCMREADVLGTVYGHFSVFDSWYPIRSWWEGDFMERMSPGAFRKTMSERGSQVVSAFDHGFDPVIGDKVLGPFTRLEEDSIGAAYDIDLLDTSYNRDLMPALKRGLYGSSFRFQVIKDEWNHEPDPSDYNPDAMPERTVKEVRLYEAGPVTYPANPAATAFMRGGATSQTDRYYDNLRRRDAAYVDSLTARAYGRRTADRSAAESTEPKSAAPISIEPTASHSCLTHAQRRERIYTYLRG